MLSEEEITDILSFWFPNDQYNKFWFMKNEEFDKFIFDKYNKLLFNIFSKNILTSYYRMQPAEILAIVLLLDQFSRNISRVNKELTPELIQQMTETARCLSYHWLNNKYNINAPDAHLVFILMPLRHLGQLIDYKMIINILEERVDSDILSKFKFHTEKRLLDIKKIVCVN